MATKKNTAIKHGDKEYNYFRITRTVDHKWKDGKKIPIKKQFVGTSKGNAEQKYKEYLEEQAAIKIAGDLEKQAITAKPFGDYADEFNDRILPKLPYAASTIEQYERAYRVHIKCTSLPTLSVGSVDIKTLQSFYESLDVSKQTLGSIHSWFTAFYKWMAANGYSDNIVPNIIKPVKKDNKMSSDIVIWEQNEIDLIYAASYSFRYRLMILLMYYAGLRISEVLGLKYDDIKDGMIHIDRQYYRGEIKAPKYDSFRVIPAHDEVLKCLSEYADDDNGGFIFKTSKGKLLDYHNVRDSFVRFYRRNGIPEKKLHAYRATFCTELCRAGVPLEVASKLMGHKNISVTAKHYALVRNDVKADAIAKLPSMGTTTDGQ